MFLTQYYTNGFYFIFDPNTSIICKLTLKYLTRRDVFSEADSTDSTCVNME